MIDEKKNPWKITGSTEVYSNPWIALTEYEVINPAGGAGIYGKVHFKNFAIGVVPLDDDLNIWLVGQYRFVLGRYSWEIPEGGCPLGTDPLDTAKRELAEETGMTASQWLKIMDIDLSNSVCDEVGHIFLARGLCFGEASPEETEELSVKKVSLDDAYRMVLDGEITDSISVVAIMRIKLMLLEGLIG